MSSNIKKDPSVAVDLDGGTGHGDYNRTVTVALPSVTVLNYDKRSSGGRKSPGKKREIEDFIKGVNINPFISSSLDMSPSVNGALDDITERYAVLEKFANGGTASVFSARDRKLSRLVAVKSLTLRDGDNTEIVNAFVTEAKVTAQLDHPGIIPIYGLFTDDKNGIHLVMKLVNGKTLREYLRNIILNYRSRGIDSFDEAAMLRRRLEIFLRVCDTIAYAHHRNVIHRDLKPENIMIGKYMEVYVMDWGLSTVIEEDGDSYVARISGTPRYFSPEVLRHEELDLRSDIFTLGLILQEVVTLQPAVSGNDEKEFMSNILEGKLEPVEHQFNRSVDKDLKAIILKATAYFMDDRYQTVDDFAEDIRRYMGGLSISARPGNFLTRMLRRIFG